jgi:choline dehydrogenase-like flavoprotein
VLIDARALPPDHVVRTGVCIVGAGPAGLSVACELAGSRLGVVVLEAGSADAERTPAEVRTRIGGTVTGEAYPPLDTVRAQGVGGTAPLWFERGQAFGVRLRPMEEQDFERRDWVPHSGWPFSRAELDPHYRRAEAAFGIGRLAPDVSASSPDAAAHALAVGPLTSVEFRFAYRRTLLDHQRRILDAAGDVDVWTGASAVELETGEDGGRVERVHVRTAPGRALAVEARWFVLAAGGIDNARLLLLSDRRHPAGLGNEHDNVGRYFADHPGFSDVGLRLRDPALVTRLGPYDGADRGGYGVIRNIQIAAEVQEREGLMNLWTSVHPRVGRRYLDAAGAARDLAAAARGPGRARAVPRALRRSAGALLRGAGPLARAAATGAREHVIPSGWSARGPSHGVFEPGALALSYHVEQAPNPDSRVVLGDTVDDLGVRLPAVDYRWSDADVESVRRSIGIIGGALAGAGVGELQLPADRGFPDRSAPSSAHHPLGTTRMHADPRRGVVDADARVHGVANLSVAGSSVFTTGGSVNPTLTLVALAMRLGEHLRRVLA